MQKSSLDACMHACPGQVGKGASGEPDQEAAANGGGAAPALLRPLRAFSATQVDPQPWVAVGLSHDMEHLAAATPAHAVYLYSLVGGALDKVLSLDGARAAAPLVFPCTPSLFVSLSDFILYIFMST